MLDLAILGLLEERDLHGYEIRQRLRDQLGLLANVSFRSLYPALNRLEKPRAPWSRDRRRRLLLTDVRQCGAADRLSER